MDAEKCYARMCGGNRKKYRSLIDLPTKPILSMPIADTFRPRNWDQIGAKKSHRDSRICVGIMLHQFVRQSCNREISMSIGITARAMILATLSCLGACGGPAPATQPSNSRPIYVAPASCRVNDGKACAGCAITCKGNEHAICKAGVESPDQTQCTFQANCSCF
jgi:hypothetical protein